MTVDGLNTSVWYLQTRLIYELLFNFRNRKSLNALDGLVLYDNVVHFVAQ